MVNSFCNAKLVHVGNNPVPLYPNQSISLTPTPPASHPQW
jgi:hypothetical protein